MHQVFIEHHYVGLKNPALLSSAEIFYYYFAQDEKQDLEQE